jgi:anti-sigma B factor antagonist
MSDPGLQIDRTDSGRAVVVKLSGELDYYSSRLLRPFLASLLQEDPERLEIDLSQLDYIDSEGAAVLLRSWRMFRDQQRKLLITSPSPQVVTIFQAMALMFLFEEPS